MTRLFGVVVLGLLGPLAVPAGADHNPTHAKPAAEAVRKLPADFPVRHDSEWEDFVLGGIGGGTERNRDHPVILVHGNNADAATWYPVIFQLRDELGYADGDLWALSYNGVGCTSDGALYTRNEGPYAEDRAESTGCVITSNDVNVPDLHQFIGDVLDYTGAEKVSIVAHSLGVTLVRRTLLVHDLYAKVAGVVAIAGGNRGTSLCPPGSEGFLNSCDELAAGSAWLEELNAAGEAPGPTRWMTVYDGSGVADPAFLGPYAESPKLEGAEANCAYPGFYHNDLRIDPRIVRDYASFLAAAEAGEPFGCPDPPPPLPE